MKTLSEMTNEELWQLFPIILTEHQASWKNQYEKEMESLTEIIGKMNIFRISHIGSTSVPILVAKPIIDILIELNEGVNIEYLIGAMSVDYIYSVQVNHPKPHMMFMKGYTTEGFLEQVVHVHIRYGGDWSELYFRDYLMHHHDVAKAYATLKQTLRKKYEHDRDGYTNAKTDFIKKYTEMARIEFKGKYDINN